MLTTENLRDDLFKNEWENKTLCVVNAANEGLKTGGEGLNRAITKFAKENGGIKNDASEDGKWKNLQIKSESNDADKYLHGEFGVSTFNNGKIFHAIGIRASKVGTNGLENLKEVEKITAKLYENMLNDARFKEMRDILLPIISGSIFADSGKDIDGKAFTREQFLNSVYQGIYDGISAHKKVKLGEHQQPLRIVFNLQ